jgi:hypothetical protein
MRNAQLWDEGLQFKAESASFMQEHLVRITKSLVFRGFMEKTLAIDSDVSLVTFRFFLELLVNLKALTPGGHVQGFGSLIAVLSDFEASALALLWLLSSKKLAGLITQWRSEEANDKSGDVRNTCSYRLLAVLARFCLLKPQLHFSKAPAMSRAVEDDLPSLEEFNALVITNAVQKLKFLKEGRKTGDVARKQKRATGALKEVLDKQRLETKARHPWAASTGRSDAQFESLEELFFQVEDADKFLVDYATVPCLPGKDVEVSSYVMDFFAHGKLKKLCEDNLMTATLAWKVIDEWCSFLDSLKSALEKGGLGNTLETDAIRVLTSQLKEKLYAEGA